MHVVAEPLQRVAHAAAGAQRDLSLERLPAGEDRDAAHRSPPARRRSGSTRAPGASRRIGRGLRRTPRRSGLGAGQRRVEPHLLADDLADALHALAQVVLADTGEVEPHGRAAAAVEERGAAGDERHVLAQRAREQVGGVDVVGQRRPDEQPAARPGPLRLAREVLVERLEQHVAPPPVVLAQDGEHVAPVALREVLDDEVLGERRRAEVGALLAEVELLEHGARGGGPAEAEPGREDLRERAEVDHVLAAVERVERRQRLALVAQQAVGIVLEHEDLALLGDLDQPAAAIQGHRHAGRVLERRDRVDELRRAALLARAGRASPRADRCACRRDPSRSGRRRPRRRRRSAPPPGTSDPRRR